MSSKKLYLAIILLGIMAIPWSQGHAGPGQQIAPGQGIPNLDFLGVWLCKSHRAANPPNPATAFRPVNYMINADGTFVTNSSTPINVTNTPPTTSAFLNSGFFGRLPTQGEWERTGPDTIEGDANGQILSDLAGAAGKVITDVTFTLTTGSEPKEDRLATHTVFTYTRFKFPCVSNTNPPIPNGQLCTVKSQASCTNGSVCDFTGEIQGEENVGAVNSIADAECVRVEKGNNRTFDHLTDP